MECLHCGNKISALRKLQDEEFCSAAHRKAYKKKQEEQAVDFLRQSKPRRAKPQVAATQPAAPVEPQPVLVLAEWQPETVAFRPLNHAPRRIAEWTEVSRQTILPGSSRVPTPSLRAWASASVVIRREGTAAQPRLGQKITVAFGRMEPALPSLAAQPIWIERAERAPVERSVAAFRSIRPVWVRAGEARAVTPMAVRFSVSPTLAGSGLAIGPVRLGLAQTKAMTIAARRRPESVQEGCAHGWQSRSRPLSLPAAGVALNGTRVASAPPLTIAKPNVRTCATAPVVRAAWHLSHERVHTPCAAAVPRVCGFTFCESVAAVKPRIRKFAVSTASGIDRSWRFSSESLRQPDVALFPAVRKFTPCEAATSPTVHAHAHAAVVPSAMARRAIDPAPESPLVGGGRLEFRAPAPRPGAHVSLKHLMRKPVSMPVTRGALCLVWKLQTRMGRDARVIPMRPRFEEPVMVAPRSAALPELSMGPRAQLEAYWFAAPLWSRQAAAILVLVIAALAGLHHLRSSGSLERTNRAWMARLRERAAIDIQDDFRGGLSQWTGAPGWANTWTYDPTGFARPGRLALLGGSRPLSDYRLEFLAEIDKKAVAWVFRAADAHNYYGYKLIESKRGTGTAFSIVRFAMVGGHERLRIQLPLPVSTTGRAMLRVRQEIRGDQFTTYLDGRVIDTWSDSALASGGFGFFADPGETAYIRWVNVAYQDDTLGRICAYLVPARHD